MSRDQASLDAVLFDFHALVESDRESRIERPIEEYLKRFPGFEAEIRAEFSWIAGADAAFLAAPGRPAQERAQESGETEPERRLGPYRLLSELGRGGQGSVWLAIDERLARRVALKVLAASASFSAEGLRRFRREAETASRLDHPAICTIYETGFEQGVHYIAMKLVEGESLADKIARARAGRDAAHGVPHGTREDPPCRPRSRAELARLLLFVEKVADALHVAHEAGIVHRDVKPGNIVVTPAGEPVVLDFGLAREAGSDESMTLTGDVVGTPTYMAPEQIGSRARELDRRVDVYALGVVLYECLVLERPHVARSREALLQAIVRDPPRDPRRFDASLPRDVVSVLEVALEKDRAQRFPTARALAEDLARIRRDEPILARPPGRAVRAARWVRRHRVALTLASVAAVLVGAAGYAWWQAHVSDVGRGKAEERASSAQSLASSAQSRFDDAEFSRALLELTSEPPSDGLVDDWKLGVERTFGLLESHGLPVRELDHSSAFDAAFRALEARNAPLASKTLDALYDAWIQLDLVARGELAQAVDSSAGTSSASADAAGLGGRRASAARAREEFERDDWACTLGGLDRLLARVDRDAWRRRIFAALRRTPGAGPGELEAFLVPDDLARRSSQDRQRLCAFLFQADSVFAAQYLLDDLVDAALPEAADRFSVRVARGWLWARLGLVDEAILDLEQALAIRDDSSSTAIGLAELHIRKQAWTKANRFAERAVNADPRDAIAHCFCSRCALELGDPERSVREAETAIGLVPEAGLPRWLLGQALFELGRFEAALRAFSRSAELAPEFVLHIGRYASALAARSGVTASLELLDDLVRERPEDPYFLAVRGAILLRCNEPVRALPDLRAASDARRHDAEILTWLGTALVHVNRNAEAIEVLEEALTISPASTEARAASFHALMRTSRVDEAATVLDGLMELEPSEPTYHIDYAGLLETRGLHAAAVEVLLGLEERFQDQPDKLVRLGMGLFSVGEAQHAWRIAHAAVALDPGSRQAWELLRICAVRSSRASLESDARRVSAEHPTVGAACLPLFEVVNKLRRTDEALAAVRESVARDAAFVDGYLYLAGTCRALARDRECEFAIACLDDLAPGDARIQDILSQLRGSR